MKTSQDMWECGITLQRVTIVRPGGNDTAIVWDTVPRNKQIEVSKMIQSMNPNIEQVMFVEWSDDLQPYGQMAGGEFCGNATRSLGYLLADGRTGQISVRVSGAPKPMSVYVSENGNAST